MQDHGGDLDLAIARFGGSPDQWIDLSTGINRLPYPIPPLSSDSWCRLPVRSDTDALCSVAAGAYRTKAAILPVAGAQAAIQMIPRMATPGTAKVLSPTYNEHAHGLRAAGWKVEEVTSPNDLTGADLAVIVNPNNPDGREIPRDEVLKLAGQFNTFVVDESFADARPDLAVAPFAGGRHGLYVLRSFGKFYGLAGIRLGFVLGHGENIRGLAEMAGPWPVSGAAIEIGRQALADVDWSRTTIARLNDDTRTMDRLAASVGWDLAGGTSLFRLYRTPDACLAQDRLAKSQIWTRRFPWSENLLRLGLPGIRTEWDRLTAAFATADQSQP